MYKTIATACSAELTIEKSRFITFARPIESEVQAKAFIEEIRREHWRATHCVPVYLLGSPYSIERYSDDGEPSGTAGVPVLSMLKGENVTDICLVVVRYFGGVKLGTGGLVRAYTAAAKAALLDQLVTVDSYSKFDCRYSYQHHDKIIYLLNSSAAQAVNSQYDAAITTQFFVGAADAEQLEAQLTELTGGTIVLSTEVVYGYILAGQFRQIANK